MTTDLVIFNTVCIGRLAIYFLVYELRVLTPNFEPFILFIVPSIQRYSYHLFHYDSFISWKKSSIIKNFNDCLFGYSFVCWQILFVKF